MQLIKSAPTYSKTRMAPTPSGYLHLGNILSFVLTANLAKNTGAAIMLRIDDLDRERVNKLYVQDIFDTLNFLEIPYHDGPRNLTEYEKEWSQVHRMELYQTALQQLKDNDAVFACTCSRTQIRSISDGDTYPGTCRHKNIALNADHVSWRLKTGAPEALNVKNVYGETIQTTLPAAMQNFVVRKKDGYPAYQLTSVVDDLYYDIDVIVRGQDLWDSTLAQHYLAPHIGAGAFRDIAFYHHPLLIGHNNEKLSKSAGATSVHYLRGEGKTRSDIFTALAGMLGMEEEIDTWEDLIALMVNWE